MGGHLTVAVSARRTAGLLSCRSAGSAGRAWWHSPACCISW